MENSDFMILLVGAGTSFLVLSLFIVALVVLNQGTDDGGSGTGGQGLWALERHCRWQDGRTKRALIRGTSSGAMRVSSS